MRIEKRDAPRTLIKIQINIESEGAYLYDYSWDMGEGGIFISTEKPLSVGETVKLKFILPEVLEEVEATGKVAWVNPPGSVDPPPGMGVKFVDLSEEMRNHIQEVINKIEGGKGVPSIEG